MSASSRVAEYLKTADLARVRETDVARYMCASRAAVQRSLQIEGTNYRALRDTERRQRCTDLIAINPRADLWLIAKKCGYTQTGSAGRAFRLWFGFTLREFKRQSA